MTPGSYPAHFGMVSHAGLNGELASPGGFGGSLTLSPQISASASAYTRSPMVMHLVEIHHELCNCKEMLTASTALFYSVFKMYYLSKQMINLTQTPVCNMFLCVANYALKIHGAVIKYMGLL